jgi:hypothetical protein
VAGVDEAGRGPLAGPVVAAACIIPASVMIPGVNDSKKLTEGKREELYSQIISTPGVIYAVCYSLLNMHLLACTFVFSMQAPFAWVFPVGSCRERVCEQIVSGSLSTSMCDLAP